jgi:hypothetical protein
VSNSLLHIGNCAQERAHQPRLLGLVLGLTGHRRLGAARGLYRRAGRARLRLWALNHGAARARAWRALADLTGLVTCADTGRAGRHGGLQNILGHVGRGGALRLQHVAGHVGLGRARRYRGLQHVLGPVDLGAVIAIVGACAAAVVTAVTAAAPAALVTRFAAGDTRRLCDVHECLAAALLHRRNNIANDEAHKENTEIHGQILHCRTLLMFAGIFLLYGSGSESLEGRTRGEIYIDGEHEDHHKKGDPQCVVLEEHSQCPLRDFADPFHLLGD